MTAVDSLDPENRMTVSSLGCISASYIPDEGLEKVRGCRQHNKAKHELARCSCGPGLADNDGTPAAGCPGKVVASRPSPGAEAESRALPAVSPRRRWGPCGHPRCPHQPAYPRLSPGGQAEEQDSRHRSAVQATFPPPRDVPPTPAGRRRGGTMGPGAGRGTPRARGARPGTARSPGPLACCPCSSPVGKPRLQPRAGGGVGALLEHHHSHRLEAGSPPCTVTDLLAQ